MSEARGRNNPTKGGSHIRAAALIPAEHEVKPDEDEDYEIYDWIFRTDDESEPGHCNSSQHPRLGPTLNFPLTVEGIPVSAMVDTGCPTTIISRNLCQKILDGGKTEQSTPDEHRWEVRKTRQTTRPIVTTLLWTGTKHWSRNGNSNLDTEDRGQSHGPCSRRCGSGHVIGNGPDGLTWTMYRGCRGSNVVGLSK